MKFIETFESLPKWAKIIFIVLVPLVGATYRVLRYTESKNQATLVWGVLSVVPYAGQVLAIIDIISEIKHNKLTFNVV